MLTACITIWNIRYRAEPFADGGLLNNLAQTLGIRHPVDVLEARSEDMPMTFGVLRPFILLPANAVAWTAERRRVVLLHELAHVRRRDVATHLLARTAWCLYWWNPLTWIAWRSFLKEGERAADDLVLTAGARPSEYAGHLLDIARGARSSPALEYAAVAMVRGSQLEDRVRAILDAGLNRNTPGSIWAIVVILLVLGVVAPLAAVRAQEPEGMKAQVLPADVDALIRSATAQRRPEILESAAQAAEQLRNFDMAQKILQSAVAIRGEVSGLSSVEYGVTLLNLANLEQRRHFKSAEEDYAKAAQVLAERPEAAPAYIQLAISALRKLDFSRAIDEFQHVQRVDSSRAGSVSMWLAVVHQRQGDMDQAASLYVSALSQQDPKSPEANTTRRLYSQFLREQGRTEEAMEVDKATAGGLRKPFTAAEGVYRMGTPGVKAPTLLHRIEPEYSEEARAAKLTGTEVLYVEIGPDGRAHNPRVMQGLGLGLDENGIDAVSQWQFQPGTKDGQPVTVGATIEINWRLM
jgi:TonB family protein